MRRRASVAGFVGLIGLVAVLAGCGSSGEEGAAADPAVAAAQTWADSVTCPSTVAGLDAAPTRPPTPRPGTDTSIMPPGEVVAVVRCDTVPGTVVDGAASEPSVGRTVLLDAQPVSWFADGDHWPSRALSNLLIPDSSVVTLHYATGPDVVVTKRVSGNEDSSLATHDNGELTCTVLTGSADDPAGPPKTTCRTNAGGADFRPDIRPVAAGAPPVDCPSHDAIEAAVATPTPVVSARPGSQASVDPERGAVVRVSCLNYGPRIEQWGALAVPKPSPTVTNPARCLSFGPPCNGVAGLSYVGYPSGPAVLTATVEDGALSDAGGWLAEAPGLGGGVTNGVIACRYSDADVRPPAVAGCLPLAQATAGALPTPSSPAQPAP